MTARAVLLLLNDGGDRDVARWSVAALAVLAVHLGLGASYFLFRPADFMAGQNAPAVIVDLAPMPAAPSSSADADPGPEMTETPPPEQPAVEPPKPEPVIEPIPPLPSPEAPVLAAPEPSPEIKPEPKPETPKPKPPEPSASNKTNPRRAPVRRHGPS